MNKIYDHEKLVNHKRCIFPQNIRLGEMASQILNGVNPNLLKRIIQQLKKEYMEEHNDILNTKQKKDHVQLTFDKILAGKYNFAKQNIQEAEKFNDFYEEAQIPLPPQEKNFKCEFCKQRQFKTNASLHSHYRSCHKKMADSALNDGEDSLEVKVERNEGFRPVKRRQQVKRQVVEHKVRKVAVEIIKLEKEEMVKKQQQPTQKEQKLQNHKRERPVSTYSFGSDIFYGDQ